MFVYQTSSCHFNERSRNSTSQVEINKNEETAATDAAMEVFVTQTVVLAPAVVLKVMQEALAPTMVMRDWHWRCW